MDSILNNENKIYLEVMTIKQIADYLQVDKKTVYRLAQKSEIPCFKIGYTWRFKKERIDKWIEEKDVMNNKKNMTSQMELFKGKKKS